MSASSIEATRRAGGRRHATTLAAVAALAGLLFGFDTAVVNGGLLLLRAQFHLNNLQAEFAAGALIAGAVLGASIAGWSGDRFGRRTMLGWTAGLFALSSIGAALPSSLIEFELARLIGGLGIGLGSTLAPVYISEIAAPATRGRLVTLNQLAVVLGILGSYFLCWALATLGPGSWRWMFGAGLIPALALLLGVFNIPESPRWLMKSGKTTEAADVLVAIAGEEEAASEKIQIEEALREERSANVRLTSPELRRPLLIAITIAVLQQITGINTVLYYGAVLFSEHMKQQTSSAIGVNIAIGVVNVVGTILSILWLDKLGRRPLLLWTFGGMAASLALLAGLFLLPHVPVLLILISVLAYVLFFAIGPGPVAWVYIAEIFPSTVRGRAASVAIVALWMACLLVTVSFLSLLHSAGPAGTFGIYAVLSLLAAVFVFQCVPETRGKSLEEISAGWRNN
jgi:SP family arabinose:H+ symporter-like MFS transporter